MLHRSAWTLAAIALLVGASTAHAAAPTPAQLAKSQRIARAYFPDACSPVSIDRSYAPDPVGGDAFSSPKRCLITLSAGFPALSFASQCSVLVHEYGHLARFSHSEDPASIMYPDPVPTVPGCVGGAIVPYSDPFKATGERTHRQWRATVVRWMHPEKHRGRHRR